MYERPDWSPPLWPFYNCWSLGAKGIAWQWTALAFQWRVPRISSHTESTVRAGARGCSLGHNPGDQWSSASTRTPPGSQCPFVAPREISSNVKPIQMNKIIIIIVITIIITTTTQQQQQFACPYITCVCCTCSASDLDPKSEPEVGQARYVTCGLGPFDCVPIYKLARPLLNLLLLMTFQRQRHSAAKQKGQQHSPKGRHRAPMCATSGHRAVLGSRHLWIAGEARPLVLASPSSASNLHADLGSEVPREWVWAKKRPSHTWAQHGKKIKLN